MFGKQAKLSFCVSSVQCNHCLYLLPLTLGSQELVTLFRAGGDQRMDTAMLSGSVSYYIGAVGMDFVLPRASITVRNTFKQAGTSPQADKWLEAIKKKLNSLRDHEVVDLTPVHTVPQWHSIIGTRCVFKVNADGRFKA